MQGSLKSEPLRTRIYIDGYNFYYGCLRGTPHKWLDLLPLFEKHILPSALIKDHDGHIRQSTLLPDPSIKYFTAKIIESVARAPDSVSSQARYHTALRMGNPSCCGRSWNWRFPFAGARPQRSSGWSSRTRT